MSLIYSGISNNEPTSCGNDVVVVSTMPWEDEDYIPRTPSGKQKSPNQIRGEIQRYIDASSETQSFIVTNRLGLSYSSFSKFMNPKTYKDQWSACQNSTYWAAARLLEKHKYEQKIAKKTTKTKTKEASSGGKRKQESNSNDENNVNGATTTITTTAVEQPSRKKSKAETKKDIETYIERIVTTTPLPNNRVYDGCPEIVKKIKEFLKRDGVTKAFFCRVIGNVNSNSMNQFLLKKKQDGAGMIAYPLSYSFFEKMRLHENKPKSKKRLRNETESTTTGGFRLETPRKSKWVISAKILPLSAAEHAAYKFW